MYQPASGCAQHPKAGQTTQHMLLSIDWTKQSKTIINFLFESDKQNTKFSGNWVLNNFESCFFLWRWIVVVVVVVVVWRVCGSWSCDRGFIFIVATKVSNEQTPAKIIVTITEKSPKLELDPLYLYSCITSPLLWFILGVQLRAPTQSKDFFWRLFRTS